MNRPKLEPDPNRPGLFTNSDWQEGTPGAFAVVIGVSNYDHLPGGIGPIAEDSYSLPQLFVSASTAFSFFKWLRDDYESLSAPIARVWLLLSPSQEELAIASDLAQIIPRIGAPTFDNCDKAIVDWFSHMKRLPLAEASKSKAFFFYSGHGLEIVYDKQLLLPSDYLKPPGENINRAISTYNLRLGLAGLSVPQQFFFVDACRNDQQNLQIAGIEGTWILKQLQTGQLQSNVTAPVLYAVGSGGQAWQPAPILNPGDVSYFGQALMEGLRGRCALNTANVPNTVDVYPLQKYVADRVPSLLQQFGNAYQQPIRLGGSVNDVSITEIKTSPAEATAISAFAESMPTHDELIVKVSTFHDPNQVPQFTRSATESFSSQAIFDEDSMNTLWDSVKIFGYHQSKPLEEGYIVHSVQVTRGQKQSRYSIELTTNLPAGERAWLEMFDGTNTFACWLPSDTLIVPRFTVDLVIEMSNARPSILSIEINLSKESISPLNLAASLWFNYRAAGMQDIAHEFAPEALSLLSDKEESPLGATIASMILLRERRGAITSDISPNDPKWVRKQWIGRVAKLMEDSPDALTLWAEHILQEPRHEENIFEMAPNSLEKLLDVGLPTMVEAFSYALLRSDQLSSDISINRQTRFRMVRLKERLGRAATFSRGAGLIMAYAGPMEVISAIRAENSMVT